MLVATAAGVGGVTVLRLAWGREQRSHLQNAIGWALIAFALVAGWVAAGAWGATVASLFAIGTALAVLGHSAIVSRPVRAKASNRRAGMLPQAGEPLGLSRRFATFLVVVSGGFAAALAVALLGRWIAMTLGVHPANGNAIALFSMPIAWTVLMVVLMMEQRQRRRITLLAVSLAAAIPPFIAGAFA
jgi:hypothetical protein